MGASSLRIIPPDTRRLWHFRDVLLLVKDYVQDLQFAYTQCRKKLKKETLKCLQLLKGMKNKPIAPLDISPVDDNLTVVVDVLREVRATTICIVGSLLSLFSIPWSERGSGKRAFGLKLIRSGCKDFYDISDELAVHSANERLEAVEITIEDLEAELDCMFRRLTETRVLLRNILTN